MIYVESFDNEDKVVLAGVESGKREVYSRDEVIKMAQSRMIQGVDIQAGTITPVDILDIVNRKVSKLQLTGKFPSPSPFVFEKGKDNTVIMKGDIILFDEGDSGDVNITVPEGVTDIASNCLSEADRGISCLAFPSSLGVINDGAFHRCAIGRVDFDNGLYEIGNSAFNNSGLTGIIELPETLRNVGDNAFSENEFLQGVVIKSKDILFGNYAFSDCPSLVSFSLPDGAKVWVSSKGLFQFCENLNNINVTQIFGTTIPDAAFRGCESLSNIIVTKKVRKIGDFAFYNCVELRDFDFTKVEKLGENSFSHSRLKGDIVFTKHLDCVPKECFMECGHIAGVDFKGGCGEFKEDCFSVAESGGNEEGDWLGYIKVNGEVKSFGDGCFCGQEGLHTLEFDDCVTSVGNYAFDACLGLKDLGSIKTVNCIGDSAFRGTGLTSVDLTILGSNIGEECFTDCNELAKVKLKSDYIGANMFASCKAYGMTVEWESVGEFSEIQDGAFLCSNLSKIELPSNLRGIGNDAFHECHMLEEIKIPSYCLNLGEQIFYDCPKLKRLICDNKDIVKKLMAEYDCFTEVVYKGTIYYRRAGLD